MKAKLNDWYEGLVGSTSTQYAVPIKEEPGWCIIRSKPGKRKKGWKMPESQAEGVRTFKSVLAQASAEYHDEEKRARWEQEYKEWVKKERKRGRDGYHMNGKLVRYLWDYIRIKIGEKGA